MRCDPRRSVVRSDVRRSLVENAQPVGGRKLFFARRQLQRIRTIHAMQRAAVRDLGNQGQRIRHWEFNSQNSVIPSAARDDKFIKGLAHVHLNNQ